MLVLYRLLLEFAYTNYIVSTYGYVGFSYNFDFYRYIFSWGLLLLLLPLISARLRFVTDFVFLVAQVRILVPISCIFGLNAQIPFLPIYCTFFSFFAIYLITRKLKFKSLKILYLKSGLLIANSLTVLMLFYLIIWYTVSGGIYNINFSLRDVYEYRAENAELTSFGILAYLNKWTMKVFSIFMLSLALWRKKLFLISLVIGAQVLFFAVSSHKAVLFYPLICVGLWLIYRWQISNSQILFAFLLFITPLIALYDDIPFLSSIFVRRLLFVPSYLTTVYFDFFAQNDHIFWSNSVLSSFLEYKYDHGLSHLIGWYVHHDENASNSNYISTGYAHAGIFGIILYTLVIAFLLRLYDYFIRKDKMPGWLVTSIVSVPIWNVVCSSDLLVSISTHGLGVATLLLLLIRNKRTEVWEGD